MMGEVRTRWRWRLLLARSRGGKGRKGEGERPVFPMLISLVGIPRIPDWVRVRILSCILL